MTFFAEIDTRDCLLECCFGRRCVRDTLVLAATENPPQTSGRGSLPTVRPLQTGLVQCRKHQREYAGWRHGHAAEALLWLPEDAGREEVSERKRRPSSTDSGGAESSRERGRVREKTTPQFHWQRRSRIGLRNYTRRKGWTSWRAIRFHLRGRSSTPAVSRR